MSSSLLSDLNKSQFAAATTSNKHTLVLAGAGCGKTKTIIARAAYLIESGVSPSSIQILTFTKRSASEIVERVKMQLGDKANGLRAATFHAWCMALIRQNPKAFGCEKATVIDREDQLQLFKMLRAEASLGKGSLSAKDMLDLYSFARNTNKSLTETLKAQNVSVSENLEVLKKVYKGYDEKKTERNYLDYDDILVIVADELENNTSVAAWVSSQCQYLLVDEMQDTNPLQWRLLNPLKEWSSLFCVGDDAQSIYGFRGADFKNVHSFKERVPDAEILKLEDNYRSTQEILNVSNWLLAESPLNYNKKLNAMNGSSGTEPSLMSFYNEFEEGRWVASDIERSHGDGAPWSSHMILVRSAFSGKPIEEALLAKKIPYRFIGGAKLLESAHVRDMLTTLRIVANHSDEIAWIRFLTLWDGVGEVLAGKITKKVMNLKTIDDIVAELKKESKIPKAAIESLSQVKKTESNVSNAILKATATLTAQLSSNYKKDWDNRKNDFKLVAKLAEKHSAILEFIEEYLLDPVSVTAVASEEIKDCVTVITVHSAKGLECDTCYVTNVSAGAYPSPYSCGSEDEIEEERRVLYVALTRAKKRLVISRKSNSSYGYSSSSDKAEKAESCYFLNNLPDELVVLDAGYGLSSKQKSDIMNQLASITKRKGLDLS